MITPDSTDHEWFQVTMVCGNFDNKQDADTFVKVAKQWAGTTFIGAEVKGSWH